MRAVPVPPGSESNNNNLIPVEPLVYMIMAGSSGFGFTATRLEPWPEMFGTMIRNKNAKNSNVSQNNINKLNFLFQQVEYKFVEDLLKVEIEIKNVSYLHIHFVTLTHLYDIFKCNNSRPFFES